jgi:hypothetical protein
LNFSSSAITNRPVVLENCTTGNLGCAIAVEHGDVNRLGRRRVTRDGDLVSEDRNMRGSRHERVTIVFIQIRRLTRILHVYAPSGINEDEVGKYLRC